MRKVNHPVTVYAEIEVSGEMIDQRFEIHKGTPSRVYKKSHTSGALRRVKDEETLLVVAKALRKGVDSKRKAEEAENKRKKGWRARFFRWVGGWFYRVVQTAFPTR